MKTVPTTEAKAKLNALLAAVAAGETVTITSHGRPVAVLTKAEEPSRKLGQFAGVISVSDDFDAPMGEDELALWGEGE
ncbi:MAG TPA: type II toxin-antitoxin system prevent-host-death family antitoxin [Flexivirga sp.]|uniref:type II toxin-antitoxin system Phd/YefM family antitoxin n=1 Tax=Flexivirga sp. TaxID=1962927 RepID=UPI002C98B869|nr:type II toxin-antitoxin system prevent-host-death family antitoxin [Flexivirga sp.]HWC22273.1 type II toxin-antitoxin system prevent-host-death family antitoxin [Flexivirga sp.]